MSGHCKRGGVMSHKYTPPKSGNSIKYISNAEGVKEVLSELERAALKEAGKFIRKEVKDRVPVDEGTLKKNVGTWVRKKDTSLQIGVYTRERAKKKKYTYAYHAHLVEFGTKKMAAKPFLRPAVMENIDQIRLIQGKYLKEIEDENRAKGLINEEEEIADD
jgi:HK97 gp10 family phage protein